MTGVMLATMLAIASNFTADTDWPSIVRPATKQVPRLQILKAGSTQPGTCSGVVLNAHAGFLLTAAHCVDGDPKDLSITVNGRHAEVARVNHILDLAVLRFAVKDEVAMELASSTPPMGTEVAIIGFSFGVKKLAPQFGRISQALNDETDTVWVNGVMIPGQSGGAVINAQGQLVGMTSRTYYRGPSAVGAAIPIEQIRDFVEAYLPAKAKNVK